MTALGAGALLPLAFAPFDFFPLAFLLPALLFLLWLDVTPTRAAWRGFLFGLGMFGVGVSWVYVSLHDFGHMPVPLAALATFLFVVVLALYPALLGFIQARWFDAQGRANAASAGRAGAADRQRPTHALLVLPALWVLFEWVRSWFLTGFPWLNLGYSQSDTWLAGYAPWLGVYGVSLVVAIASGLLAQSLRAPEKFLRRYLPVLLAIFLGGWLAGKVEWTEPAGAPLPVALVQGNVPLELKWQPAYRNAILERYRSLSEQAGDAQLIVWPEAAIPARLDEIDPTYLAELKRRNADFLVGVVERDQTTRQYYNSVVSLGRGSGLYRKQHLVPFGEFLPFPALFRWLLDSLHIPMSDFSRGTADQPPLTAAGQKIGVSVCYEDAFGEEIIRALPQATLLVNVSEDAWFGNSLAPHQRLQIARLRALEASRPMLRAANTGPSAAIDHHGNVVTRSPQFEAAVLRTVVQPRQGHTLYARYGNVPTLGFIGLLLVFAAWRDRHRAL
ncbi:MAG TPA: apolipoprotein N-acyltransferase [Burkholderiales bacterium]|nr:apolipoprotein N-acyltransferase [Burkholderiales bacterium]